MFCRTTEALSPLSLPHSFVRHHALLGGQGLCLTTMPHLCPSKPLSQPTSLHLLPQTQSAAPPSPGPFSLTRLSMCPTSRCRHLTRNPVAAHILGHGMWQRPPHLPPGWSATFSRAGVGFAQIWIPTLSSEACVRSWAEDTVCRPVFCPALRVAEHGGLCSGVTSSPTGPEKPYGLQRQAPASLKPSSPSILLSGPCP